MLKKWLRILIKIIAAAAALALVFVNRVSTTAGIVLLVSAGVLIVCVWIWQKFDLGDDDWFSPRKSDK